MHTTAQYVPLNSTSWAPRFPIGDQSPWQPAAYPMSTDTLRRHSHAAMAETPLPPGISPASSSALVSIIIVHCVSQRSLGNLNSFSPTPIVSSRDHLPEAITYLGGRFPCHKNIYRVYTE